MSSIITPLSYSGPPPEGPIRRISVEKYHAMIQAGIFDEDDRVELLEGWLVDTMSKKPPHATATDLIRTALDKLLPPGWFTRSQDPITTADSEPEPDVSVVRGNRRTYTDRHPGPADIGLLVEVSDATLSRDRGVKKTIYARAAVPVYWVVNLVAQQVEVFADPTGPADPPDYQQRWQFELNDSVPVTLDGQEIGHIAVKDMMP